MNGGQAVAILAGIASLGCAAQRGAGAAVGNEAPEGIMARAIGSAGGSAALERARALVWEGEATVHAGGRTVRLTGHWAVQPPESAVVSTYETSRGPASVRRLILSGDRGWLERGGQLTPMPPTVLANERQQFYLYSVMRLVPLRASAAQLSAIAPDSLGQRGVRVTQAGRPDVDVFVDNTGRLAHLRTRVTDAMTGNPAVEDVWLAGVVEADGVRWPRSVRITLDGKPYFEMEIRTLRVMARLEDPLLAGPK
ncbi:MAG: hypothetical protein ABR499_20235 [Gemmatimonadaceae bacterium]